MIRLVTLLFLSVSTSVIWAEPSIQMTWREDLEAGNGTHSLLVEGVNKLDMKGVGVAGWGLEQWHALLSVTVEPKVGGWQFQLPDLAGNYSVKGEVILFSPHFPLTPGVTYRSVFRPNKLPASTEGQEPIVSRFHLPLNEREPTTLVSQIYPSPDLLPENLLKFYIHFSAPMSGGRVYDHIRLFDDTGTPVELPFLEIDEELWNLEMTRLTLFIDPGRIKRGVKPLEDIGPSLTEGREYKLSILSSWKDAHGTPLASGHTKTFKVTAPDREPPRPDQWGISIPSSGSFEPLKVAFGECMDHALASRMLHVVDSQGRALQGRVTVEMNESVWRFYSEKAWSVGDYQLLVQTHIEDLAGNNIGKPFEVDLFGEPRKRLSASTYPLSFRIE